MVQIEMDDMRGEMSVRVYAAHNLEDVYVG